MDEQWTPDPIDGVIESREQPRGEIKLMIAILEAAIFGVRRKVRSDIEWINSDSDGWIYSYRGICEALKLDPGAVRAKVFRMGPVKRKRSSLISRMVRPGVKHRRSAA